MATLKEHQAAMVDLLANGSGIPASASRLAHAMHDVLSAILSEPDLMAKAIAESKAIREAYTTPGLNDKALSKREKVLKTDSPVKWPTPAEQRVKELENTIRQLKAQTAKYKVEVVELKQERSGLIEAGLKALDETRDIVSRLEATEAKWAEVEKYFWLAVDSQCCSGYETYGVKAIDAWLAQRLKQEPEQAGCRKCDTELARYPLQPAVREWSGVTRGAGHGLSDNGIDPVRSK